MNNIAKKRNIYLDAIRGVACFLVIFGHRPFPGTVGHIISAIARAGVAIFFIISGYYTYNTNPDIMRKRMPYKTIHTLKILLYALLYYLVWESFIRWVGSGLSSTFDWITNHVLNPYTWYLALVWDRDPVAGHLWFLFALVRCYILFAILLMLRLEKYAPALSVICLSATLVMQGANMETFYFRNGWFYGMGFFLAGYFIASHNQKQMRRNLIYIGIISGLLLSAIGGMIFPNEQIYIGAIILGISVFCWAVTKTGDMSNHILVDILATIGATYGTLIYVIHWSIKECLIKLDKTFVFTQSILYQWISPILLAVLSVVSCVFLYHLIDKLTNVVRKKNE